jgi:hypothetical protein
MQKHYLGHNPDTQGNAYIKDTQDPGKYFYTPINEN